MDKNIRCTSIVLFSAIFVATAPSKAFSQQPKKTTGESRQSGSVEFITGKQGQLAAGDRKQEIKNMRSRLQGLKDEKKEIIKQISEKGSRDSGRSASGNQESPLENLNLQEKMNRSTKLMQTQSNISRNISKTEKAIINKVH